MSSNTMPPSAANLGRKFGDDIFELTRRRFASQGAATRGRLSSRFAARGATGSGASASAQQDLNRAELRALGDSSLSAQGQGMQFGQQEAGRLEGIRQFGQNMDFQNRGLAQNAALTREGFMNQQQMQQSQFQQQMQMAQLMERFRKQQQRSGMFGSIFGGLGSFLGSSVLPGLGTSIGGTLGSMLGGTVNGQS